MPFRGSGRLWRSAESRNPEGSSEGLKATPEQAGGSSMKWVAVLLTLLAPLQLSELMRQVERNHPKLQGAHLVRQMAEAKTLEKRGAFDPSIGFYSLAQRYNSSPRGSAKSYWANGLAYGYLDRSGLKLQAGYRNHRGDIKSPTSTTGDGGELFVDVKLPLLRGAGINEKFAAEQKALVGEKTAEAVYNLVRLETLLKAGEAYWDWVVTARQLKLLEQNLELAEWRATNVKERIEAGDLAPVDRVEVDQTVAKRQEILVKGEREFQKAQLKLAFFLWGDDGVAQQPPSAERAPEELPLPTMVSDAERAQAEVEALQLRPELRGIRFEKERVEIDRELAENERLPVFDVVVSPGYDIGQQSVGATIKAGLEVTIPLATRTADGKLLAARLKTDKLELEQLEMIRAIVLQVYDAESAIRTAVGRYEAAVESLKLARELEQAERLRFDLGDGTVFLVNQREIASLSAALKVLELEAEYARARLLFEAVGGRL